MTNTHRAFNDPTVDCCGRDAADCDCGVIRPDDEIIGHVTRGYITALLWANALDSNGEPVSGAHHDYAPVSLSDFTPNAQASIVADVWDFVSSNADDFRAYVEQSDEPERKAAELFGHDFLLTRSGHGAGFWDRGLAELGERLSDNARPYGDVYAIVDPDTAPGDIKYG